MGFVFFFSGRAELRTSMYILNQYILKNVIGHCKALKWLII